MDLQTKALYHLLRMNHANDPSVPCEKWQVEDLRKVSLEELFPRMAKMGVPLSEQSFCQFAEECDSPEDLAELLITDQEDPKRYDAAYLVVFELWRRLLPEKQSLSIFCDELDDLISRYYAGELESDEPIQDALSNLDEILNENLDAGVKPALIFEKISSYFAHDLMAFIIDFISKLLDAKNQLYATELIENFAPYAPKLIWFDFLRTRFIAFTDPIEANRRINELLKFDDKLTLDLLLEMLRFQVGYGERSVFLAVVKKIIPRLQEEEDFRELLELSSDYCRRRDREDLEQGIHDLLTNRQNLRKAFSSSDPDLQVFEKLIHIGMG